MIIPTIGRIIASNPASILILIGVLLYLVKDGLGVPLIALGVIAHFLWIFFRGR